MTNFEKLKADIQGMTAEEFISRYGTLCKQCFYQYTDCFDEECREGRTKWLESEVEE